MLVQLLLQAEIQPTRKGVVERSCGHAIIMRVLSPRDQCRDRADEVSKVLVGLAIDMKMNMTLLEDEAIFGADAGAAAAASGTFIIRAPVPAFISAKVWVGSEPSSPRALVQQAAALSSHLASDLRFDF